MDGEEDIVFFAKTRKRPRPPTDSREISLESEKNVPPTRVLPSASEAPFLLLGVDTWLAEALRALSIVNPTEVQQICIPKIIAQYDVIAAAKTGSGKTAAFAVPILNDLGREPRGLFAVILTPTRELAIQISEQIQALGRAIHVNICTAVGGLDMMEQTIQISRRPHIIVATPGRLCDLLQSNNLYFGSVKYLVFDEADRLLAPDSSFMKSEIPFIMQKINVAAARLLYFSATMSAAVRTFHGTLLREPQTLYEHNCNQEFGLPESLRQFYILMPGQVRDTHLVHLLRGRLASKTVMIFVGKCRTCALLTETLKKLKIFAVGLHGKMSQKQRLSSLLKFRSGLCKILISTDVGSRGLDIPAVEFVVNFDIPANPRDYVHRVGRAARAGRSGTAISLVNELDIDIFRNVERIVDHSVPLYPFVPPESEIISIINEVSVAKRTAEINLYDSNFGAKQDRNKMKWAKLQRQ